MNKKERERVKQERTERESKARSESENRKARIEELWHEIRRLVPKNTAKNLAENELVVSLVELADEQKREIQYLTQFLRHTENLSSTSVDAKLWPLITKWAEQRPSKKVYEAKRMVPRIGQIERQFGGPKKFDFLAGKLGRPTGDCLDDIFAGDGVNMRRLQELFGIHRNRLRPWLPKKENAERLYDYHAVVTIMDALLSERPRERKRPPRGRPSRLWLSDSDLRRRVLSGIEVRLNTVAMAEHIKATFLGVVRRHLPDSAKK